ncbi:MAG: TaqI-like C-terminal specificity domain-containing protein [Nitrospira sp.]|nr:TaqI-like C-terminal specificity domain-containing protein [Nitrospira sp.]
MPTETERREKIVAVLSAFTHQPLREVATNFLATLGYRSDRTLDLGDSSPQKFLELVRSHAGAGGFSEFKTIFSDWISADLLFQLTDEELSRHASLFKDTAVNPGLLRSYVFFAIELKGGDYTRGKLTGIAREINRVFPMPVMVLIKHLKDKEPVLSVTVINRRQHKRDTAKDVLGKVTIIRDIRLTQPHRGHVDILASFALPNLVHPQRLPIDCFDNLYAAWEEIFNIELLNKRFYRELANWYFWALPQVDFPADTEKDDEKRRATSLIRLLTRLIFCWFLKEKGLIAEKLFVEAELKPILKDLASDANTYHQAILQNLFFATLNQRMGKDKNGQPYRTFARDEGFLKNRTTYGVDTLYRYEEHFRDPSTALDHFADVPFLNGGLFECLDRPEEGTDRKLYVDGFSRNKKKRAIVPNRLFFAEEQTVDLSDAYGEAKRRNERVRGLLRILHSYKFTIVENTPIDQEIALDPELLGKVFENLLASYNEETKTTARKQTGSFYTPRPIVEYMVDESLKAHLNGALTKIGMSEKEAQVGLAILFAYTERQHPFREREVAALLDAIHSCKILDPACGSGAFPMGMLHKLVYIIHKLDPDNGRWKQLQIDAAAKIPDSSSREAAIAAIERDFADNEDDYGRKLYLIENCLYGVDIQPIAIQIAKLRFFISLVCDQRTNRNKKENHGVRPLPNLETKFVAADTLIGLPEIGQMALVPQRVYQIETEIEALYHKHFAIQRRDHKLALQRKIKDLRNELGKLLAESLMAPKKAQHVADWDPFDPQSSADFFDPHWMFGRSLADGFDVVIGNPPYIEFKKLSPVAKRLYEPLYSSASGKYDIFVVFVERAGQLARPNGCICYIMPTTFLRKDFGQGIRRFIFEALHPLLIHDFSDIQMFDGPINYTGIFLFRKHPADPGGNFPYHRYKRVGSSNNPTFDSAVESLYAEDATPIKEVSRIGYSELALPTWDFQSSETDSLIQQISQGHKTLQAYTSAIFQGIASGKDEVFYVTKQEAEGYRLEPELLKPLLKGRDIKRYAVTWSGTYVIYPYNKESRVIAEAELQQRYPQAMKYLLDRRLLLEGRGYFDKSNKKWFELWNQRKRCNFEKVRIVTPEISDRNHFARTEKFYGNTKTYHILPKDTSEEFCCYLLALLNSSTLEFYYKSITTPQAGGFFAYKTAFLERIPIKSPHPIALRIFEKVVPLIQFAKRIGEEAPAQFLDDLIDACVMECYFREHMAERDLLFLEDLAAPLAAYEPTASEAQQREFLAHLHRTLNATSSKIRNRLLRITADSPDLLAVIKNEGRV